MQSAEPLKELIACVVVANCEGGACGERRLAEVGPTRGAGFEQDQG